MKAPELLGVIIRVCGLVAIVWGLWQGCGALQNIPSAVLAGEMPLRTALYWLATVMAGIGFGGICFFCADWLVALSYRRSVPDSSPRASVGTHPRDIFGLVVRSLGMAVFLYGAYYLVYGLADAVGLSKESSAGEMRAYFIFGIPAAFFGLAMVGGASAVVKFSFHLEDRRTTSTPIPPGEETGNLANLQGGANGSQPFSAETNRTSAAAASRRSA